MKVIAIIVLYNPEREKVIENVTTTEKYENIEISPVIENTVNTKVAGTYKVTYKVTDSANQQVTKTIKVTVIGNDAPVITANDKELTVGDTFDEKSNVTAKVSIQCA